MKKSPTKAAKTITGSWYDYPQYYDIAFSEDTAEELEFIEAACRKYCPFPLRSLVEPGMRVRSARLRIGGARLRNDRHRSGRTGARFSA